MARGAALGLPTWSAQITRSGAVPNDEANDQAVVHIGTVRVLAEVLVTQGGAIDLRGSRRSRTLP